MSIYFAVSTLRELSSLELHQLYKLRVDVFVSEQRTPYAEIDDTDALDSTYHILAWSRPGNNANAQLVGCARLFPGDDGAAHLGRLVVDPEFRHQGLGGQIILQTMRLALERFDSGVKLEAQAQLTDYYRGFGFETCGNVWPDTGVPHQPMQISKEKLVEVLRERNMLTA